MSKDVKRRPYDSQVRREAAAQTRARILDAAWARFDDQGYARTTIRQIAEDAGVAPDTVYAVFGNKPSVLTALIDQRLVPRGDRNVWERPQAIAIRDEADQRRQVHLFAQDITEISTRVRPVVEIMRTASAVDDEMARVYREQEGYRLRNMQMVTGWIAANGPLRVSDDRAAEIIWTLASPDVGRLLCDVLGWTRDEHATWLEGALVSALLPDDAA
jgi:AcrR family transcriptional regulator